MMEIGLKSGFVSVSYISCDAFHLANSFIGRGGSSFVSVTTNIPNLAISAQGVGINVDGGDLDYEYKLTTNRYPFPLFKIIVVIITTIHISLFLIYHVFVVLYIIYERAPSSPDLL